MFALCVILLLVVTHHFLERLVSIVMKDGSFKLKTQVLKLQQELAKISAQDEFAKWAKTNRKLEQARKDYNNLKTESKSSHDNRFKILNYSLYGLEIIALIYWSSEPMFYIPNEWFGPLTSWLKFPFAPMGSVGAFYWWSALKSVLGRLF